MSRWLALDIGQKRTGIAVTDPLRITPNPLEVVNTYQLISYLHHYFQKEQVSRVIIGKPVQLNGLPSESIRYVMPMAENLKKSFPSMPFVWYDERFTTSIALDTIKSSGISKMKRRDKALADAIAATLILRDYMDSVYASNA